MAAVVPFVALGAIALAACGSDAGSGSDTAAEEAEAVTEPAEESSGAGVGAAADTDTGTEPEPDGDGGAEPETDGDGDGDAEPETDGDGDGDGDAEPETDGELFPDVLDATAAIDADGTWTFAATLSSPYDTPERYADAWRVVGPDGTVFGVRELAHDHAAEQPFTRSHSGIEIPESVTTVTVEGRDQVSGWGGATVEVELTR